MTADNNGATVDTLQAALRASAQRLAAMIEALAPEDLERPAYPTEWTIADVLSHVGSGAEITRLRLDGAELTPQPIWDRWNAKTPGEQAADALAADRVLLERVDSLTAPERDTLRFAIGPFELDLAAFLGMRLNEHVVHTWDIAVALEPAAVIPDAAAEVVVDRLSMVAGFAGKPTGGERTLNVRTSAPTRLLEVALRDGAVALSSGDPAVAPDLEMPAEAFIRLVYGRLDPGHTPAISGAGEDLDLLRHTFPGF
jgi:uncharacterized protein (TIGR03083 family)